MARVATIMRDGVEVDAMCPSDGEEVGLRLDRRCFPGDILALIPPPPERDVVEAEVPEPEAEESDLQITESDLQIVAEHQVDMPPLEG